MSIDTLFYVVIGSFLTCVASAKYKAWTEFNFSLIIMVFSVILLVLRIIS